MSKKLSLTFVLLCLAYNSGIATTQNITGNACPNGWESYLDTKCFKVFDDKFVDYTNALAHCAGLGPETYPPIIHSQTEQDFLQDLVFNKHKIINGVWIGAKVSNKVMTWADNTKVDYENWLDKRPINETNECVQMTADKLQTGKWIDEPCGKLNLVVCQQLPPFKYLEMIMLKLNTKLDAIIPIGFLYTQLPDQAAPQIIWPQFEWENVTPKYAGLFLRAEGGDSKAFNDSVQDDNSPRLTGVKWLVIPNRTTSINIVPGSWSPYVFNAGGTSGTNNDAHSFQVSGGEVRPKNRAMRIFKRIK